MKHLKIWVSVLLLLCLTLVSCTGENGGGDGTSGAPTETPTEAITDPPAPRTKLKVMSFNLYGTDKKDDRTVNESPKSVDGRISIRSEKLRQLLIGENIDIAGLQEVTSTWLNYLRGDEMKDLYSVVGYRTKESDQGGYIIYRKDRFKVADKGVFWLVEGAPTKTDKHPDSNFDRMCTWVVFQVIETGEYFLFLDTHLDTVSDEVRTSQADVIVSQVSVLRKKVESDFGYKNCALVLVGDMNAEPQEGAYGVLTSNLRDSNMISKGTTVSQEYSTSPGYWYCKDETAVKKDGHFIDYIFVNSGVRVENFYMIQAATNLCQYGGYISDHNAVIAEIVLP